MLDKIQGGNKNAFNSWGGLFFCRKLFRGAEKKGVGFASFLWKLRGAIFQHMPWSEWAPLNFRRLWWFLTLCFCTLLLHLNGHYVHIQYIAYLRIWQRCNWGKVGEVWTVWLDLLIQNQVVQPHNKKSNQNKPRISGVILIWFFIMWLYNLVLH